MVQLGPKEGGGLMAIYEYEVHFTYHHADGSQNSYNARTKGGRPRTAIARALDAAEYRQPSLGEAIQVVITCTRSMVPA